MPNTGPAALDSDFDNVDPQRPILNRPPTQITLNRQLQMTAFIGADRFRRRTVTFAPARLDFYKNHAASVMGDQINLAGPAAKVALDDTVALLL
jgi:hypothetical protein